MLLCMVRGEECLKPVSSSQERVNHYAKELSSIRKHQSDYRNALDRHVFEVNTGYTDAFDYHHNLYKGAPDLNYKFYVPELVADYVRRI